MLPHDVCREAAKLIRTGGHSQGCHARDRLGREVLLVVNTQGKEQVDTSRATITTEATAFSIYGALASVMALNPCNPTPIWIAVRDEAIRSMEGKRAVGGANHLHPVILFNEHMDTDKNAAVAFLERVALLLEPKGKQTPEVPAT